MSILIVNSYIDGRHCNDVTCIDFITQGNVANIEEINWRIHKNYFLRGELLKSSDTLLKRCGAIIILEGVEGCNYFNLNGLNIPEEFGKIT